MKIKKLKIKKIAGIIAVCDWDEFIQDVYKKPYSFQQQEGCRERQTFKLNVPAYEEDYPSTVPQGNDWEGVSFHAWLEKDPNEEKNILWWARKFYPHISMIANDLLAKGLIEPGEYYIDVNW